MTLRVLVLASLAACAAATHDPSTHDPSTEDADELALCDAASEYFSDCAGRVVDLRPVCDPALAAEVLDTPCVALGNPGKADIFGDAFCASGLLYWCALPTCDDAPTVDELLDHHVGQCEALMELPGCGSCAYYECLELERGEHACGSRGYYEGFVAPYCHRFTQLTRPTLSDEGQQWIDDVRRCLQESVRHLDAEASCDEIHRTGFDAHPGCYVDTGFCELSIADKWKIFTTVDPRDLGLRQPLSTALRCAGL